MSCDEQVQLPHIHKQCSTGKPLRQNCLMTSSSVEVLHPKIRKKQHHQLPSVFPYSSCANVTNSNNAAAFTKPDSHQVVMFTTHLTELNALKNAKILAQLELEDEQTLVAHRFLRGILPTAEHLRLYELEVAARETKQKFLEDHLSKLDRQCWKKMVVERNLMHAEESCMRAVKVRALWKAEIEELERTKRLQKLVAEAAQKYREWIKERGKLPDNPLENLANIVEWICHSCKRINTVLIFGCEHCSEKRRFDVEQSEVYKRKERFDTDGRLLPSVLQAVVHRINSHALSNNVDGVLSQMLEFSGTDATALATGCAALGQVLLNVVEGGVDQELKDFEVTFLPKAIDCLIFASRSCPEDVYVQRSAMNGLWWSAELLGANAIRNLLQNTNSLAAIAESMHRRQLDSIVQWRGTLLIGGVFTFLCNSLQLPLKKPSTNPTAMDRDIDEFIQYTLLTFVRLSAPSLKRVLRVKGLPGNIYIYAKQTLHSMMPFLQKDK